MYPLFVTEMSHCLAELYKILMLWSVLAMLCFLRDV